jgi:hypothetical protein
MKIFVASFSGKLENQLDRHGSNFGLLVRSWLEEMEAETNIPSLFLIFNDMYISLVSLCDQG